MSSHSTAGASGGSDPALRANQHQPAVYNTEYQREWPLRTIGIYYAAILADAIIATTAALIIAKFAFHQNIDFTGKTFWTIAGSSLGGAIALPLLAGGIIHFRRTQKEYAAKKEANDRRIADERRAESAHASAAPAQAAQANQTPSNLPPPSPVIVAVSNERRNNEASTTATHAVSLPSPSVTEQLEICVKPEALPTSAGLKLTLLKPTDTIRTVKEKIKGKEGIPVETQHLSYRGTELLDERTLESYNIEEGSTLHIRWDDPT